MMQVIAVGLWLVLAQPISYEFVPRVNRLVEYSRPDGTVLIGRLDANGDFTLTSTVPVPVPPEMRGMDFAFYESGPDSPVPIGVRALNPQPVYELRSGALIPGTMAAKGPFVPKVGGAIIRFADYRYSTTATKIWNLPGFFRLVIPGQLPVGPEEPIRIPNPAWQWEAPKVPLAPKR